MFVYLQVMLGKFKTQRKIIIPDQETHRENTKYEAHRGAQSEPASSSRGTSTCRRVWGQQVSISFL